MDFDRIILLADETANWTIGGLRQLDRLALSVNEAAESLGNANKIHILVLWDQKVPEQERNHPNPACLEHCELRVVSGAALPRNSVVLSTRMLLRRGALAALLPMLPKVGDDELDSTQLQAPCRGTDKCFYLEGSGDVPRAERWLLHVMGKSQDGLVARFLNRPISRAISRFLLKTPMTPRGWTLSIFVLPVLASLFAQRGDYFGFVMGTALLQLFSVLDGCDGEIARARFLDSDRGGRLDKWCDVIGGFVFIIGLGLGLYRKHGLEPHAWIYLAEALACIVLITWNELRLERAPQANVVSSTLERLLYPRHRELIQHSGILFLGANAVWWIVQLTKRDLSMLVFLALAIANQAECILPLWIVITAAVLLLSAVAHRKRGANASTPAE